MNKQNWDDMRFVLAVARDGSLNATAKRLGVTHATVMRRVAAFEARYGQPVFLKTPAGYSVLPEAASILSAARNVEDAVYSVERAVMGSDQTLSGNVRIASTDSICQLLLPDISKEISKAYPDLTLTLLSANTYHDLSRLSADIAIRPTPRLEDGQVGHVAGQLAFALYSVDPEERSWIGLRGPLERSLAAAWMAKNVPDKHVVHGADSFLVLRSMVASGLGKAFLPRFIGDMDNRLHRINLDEQELAVPVWIAVQEEMSRNVRFKAVRELLTSELGRALAY